MSNLKNVNAKKESSKLTTINLSKFANLKVSEVVKTQKSTLYNYPENWNALQINAGEGKSFRTKKRNKLMQFANNICVFAKHNRLNDLIEEIKKFDIFYKEIFKLNDYSINSLTHTKEEKNAFYCDMLEIIKIVKAGSITKEKKAAKKPAIQKEKIAKVKVVAPIEKEIVNA